MRYKKILKLVIFAILIMCVTENVFAEEFYCEALGESVKIDYQVAHIIKYVILTIQLAVPVVLVIMGSIDLTKGIISQKDDEIASGRKTFIKRLVTGAIVFFVFALVKLVVSFVDTDEGNILSCVKCFVEKPSSSC